MSSNIIDSKENNFDSLIKEITINPYNDDVNFFKHIKSISDKLPSTIKEKLHDFYLHGNDSGIILLSSCPLEHGIETIPTPKGFSNKKTFISESCLAIVASYFGDIFGYKEIDDGIKFHNIVPLEGMEYEQSYGGSKVDLKFHTEQHFHENSPDYLLLFTL
ncbi:MAG: hypothetical protein DRG78_16230 [Epsilonproteobacteria bacterium]|nr:MAG: hypothetical protein DRG78_16230 [Campylobacterota bacterium]